MGSCKILKSPEQVCDSRGEAGVPRAEEDIAVSLCSLACCAKPLASPVLAPTHHAGV